MSKHLRVLTSNPDFSLKALRGMSININNVSRFFKDKGGDDILILIYDDKSHIISIDIEQGGFKFSDLSKENDYNGWMYMILSIQDQDEFVRKKNWYAEIGENNLYIERKNSMITDDQYMKINDFFKKDQFDLKPFLVIKEKDIEIY